MTADLWTADELPGLLWEPDHTPATPDLGHAELRDLRRCGLTGWQMHTITTIETSPEYL